MCVRHEHTCDEILILHGNSGSTFAAAMLRPIGRKRGPLHITTMGHSHDHIFALDQIFVVHIGAAEGKLRPARDSEFLFHFTELAADNVEHART